MQALWDDLNKVKKLAELQWEENEERMFTLEETVAKIQLEQDGAARSELEALKKSVDEKMDKQSERI